MHDNAVVGSRCKYVQCHLETEEDFSGEQGPRGMDIYGFTNLEKGFFLSNRHVSQEKQAFVARDRFVRLKHWILTFIEHT